MISAYTLFSGSSGNCIYIKHKDTEILIDAGKSCGAIEKALNSLGTSLCNISAIFLTHEHSDHTSALEMISKKHGIIVNMTSPSYENLVKGGTFLERYADMQSVVYEKKIGTLCVNSFPVPHDSKQNVGYLISSPSSTFGVATDIGHLTVTIGDSLSQCKQVIVESNHDIRMLENGPYPPYLKERILSPNGHLSNDSCARFASYLCDHGVRQLTLAHLSKENNTPELAFRTTRSALDGYGFENVALKVASPDKIVCATDNR